MEKFLQNKYNKRFTPLKVSLPQNIINLEKQKYTTYE